MSRTRTVDADGDSAERVDALEAENRRLRDEYARATTARYRRTAWRLAGVAGVALVAGVLLAGERAVLFALAGTAALAAVLTAAVTPARVVPASVDERVYDAVAANWDGVRRDLDLRGDPTYVPRDADVRLFVPERAGDVPPSDALDATFVADGGTRGVALEPVGGPLFREVERALDADLADDPATLVEQVLAGVVDQFELAGDVDRDLDADAGRLAVRVESPAFGPVERFDHPASSLVAVGLARGLDRPVRVEEVAAVDDDYVVALDWEPAS